MVFVGLFFFIGGLTGMVAASLDYCVKRKFFVPV